MAIAACLLGGSLGLASPPAEAAVPVWTITHLRPLPDHVGSTVHDVNNAGIAVGYSTPAQVLPFDTAPVVWSANGTPKELPETPGGGKGEALAINDAGVIVGQVAQMDCCGAIVGTRPVRWVPNGSSYTVELLQPAGWVGNGHPSDINGAGVIIGTTFTGPGIRPSLFRPGQDPVHLPTSPNHGWATRINDGNVAIGMNDGKPAAWYAGQRYDLYPELAGQTVETQDIINSMYTLSTLTTGDGRILSFLQHPNGAIYPLVSPTFHTAQAFDLNEHGIAAGHAGNGTDPTYAALFVYGTTFGIESLLSPADQAIWGRLDRASSLNDGVTVVGNGTRDGYERPQAWLVRPPQ
jgi:hypothetical protein